MKKLFLLIMAISIFSLGCSQPKHLSPSNKEVRSAIEKATALPKNARKFLKDEAKAGRLNSSSLRFRFYFGGRLSYLVALNMKLPKQSFAQMQEFSIFHNSKSETEHPFYLGHPKYGWNSFSGDRIFDIKHTTKDGITTGTFRFFVPESCAGIATFTIKPMGDKFIVTQIKFPKNNFKLYFESMTGSLGPDLLLIYRTNFYGNYNASYREALRQIEKTNLE